MKTFTLFLALALLISSTTACTSEDSAGEGSLELSIAGGAALREGFPHSDGGTSYEFVDGWSIQYNKYIVSYGNVELRDPANGDVVSSWAGPAVIDLMKDSDATVTMVTLDNVPAKRLDLAFDLVVPSADAPMNTADSEDLAEMAAEGWTMLIAGVAERDGEQVNFRFGLAIPTQFFDCINGKDQSKGIVIEANKTTGGYIYPHAIHMWWDTLGTGDEDIRFDAFAAVAMMKAT